MLIITGMSGAGKSIALNFLEDFGYYCIDNLPVILLDDFVDKVVKNSERKIAIAIDIRSSKNIAQTEEYIRKIKEKIDLQIIFLTAKQEVLAQRFNETRRPHPLHNWQPQHSNVLSFIEQEKIELQALNNLVDIFIDTTFFTAMDLREKLSKLLNIQNKLFIFLQSFGFKQGLPVNADFVFDTRSLPNPYWEKNIRHFSGRQKPIIDWLKTHKSVEKFISNLAQYLENTLPDFLQQSKQRAYVNICIGCTGGQHRSVYVVEELHKRLSAQFELNIEHRDAVDYVV
ncbi:MAG: RNase adapter RapZ [Cardiobacteriaceae bacterium]|nr:RNase adapter RapZ [Cardiobacteriaceae bacterium]